MRVLLTGARGLLAAAIVRELGTVADVHAFDRQQLDVADVEAVRAAVEATAPDAIVNCAAYNHVDKAEDEPGAALRVNATGVLALARAAAAAGATLVHYGTDFVFDGERDTPWTEEDRPNPRNAYGLSKLLGDWLALDLPTAYVLRVESLFGVPGKGHAPKGSVENILQRIRAREPVPVFVDRTVSPTSTSDIARATRLLLTSGAPSGLYHCVNTGAATWAEVASEAARLLGLPIETRPLTLEAAKLRAARPRYSALSNAKLVAAGVPMPAWQDALAEYLAS